MKSEGNRVSWYWQDGLRKPDEKLMAEISAKTGFVLATDFGRSRWWGSSQIGAYHYRGQKDGQEAVLKLQVAPQLTSEQKMIKSFSRYNQSKLVRPPRIYNYLPWDDKEGYEVLVLEFAGSKKLISDYPREEEIDRFFTIYRDYRQNCLNTAWLEKPQKLIATIVSENFSRWQKASQEIYPDHPLRNSGDQGLINKAVACLVNGYQEKAPEFVHGHFSGSDLYPVGNKVVLLSNLYWSWRPRFYDLVFAYHWSMINLANQAGVDPVAVDQKRQYWLSRIEAEARRSRAGWKKDLDLALLERAAASLNLDSLMADPNSQAVAYLREVSRKEIDSLISALS
jgi:hypothetical protein